MFPKEPTPEEEERLIEKAVELITKNDMEDVAILFFGTIKPGVYIAGELSRVFLAPLLTFTGDTGYNILSVFEKKENIDKIIQKLDQARKEKEEKKRKEEEKRKASEKESGRSWYSKLKEKVHRFRRKS